MDCSPALARNSNCDACARLNRLFIKTHPEMKKTIVGRKGICLLVMKSPATACVIKQ